MDRLIHVHEQEIRIDFRMACKCQTSIHLNNTMETMPVAFKVQTTTPQKFSVKPRNGILLPSGNIVLQVILKPQSTLPENFPLSEDKFVVKSVVAPIASPLGDEFPAKFLRDLFTNQTGRVFVDAKLSVVYVGNLLLRNLVAKQDIDSVKYVLQRQTSCDNGCDEAGKTALHIAAASGNVEMVKVLLEAGAKLHAASKNGQTAFLEAAYMAQLEVMKVLLDYGADIEAQNIRDLRAIHLSSMLNHCVILRFLIDRGASLEARDNSGRTSLHCAITEGHIEPVKILLKAGADKDACSFDGRSALYRAASKGNLKIVRLLMDMGANPESRSHGGKSPFDVAMKKGHGEVMEALREGKDLLKAARRGQVKAVVDSLKNASDVNVRDQWGCTGLHFAALKGHVEVVAALLEYGADMTETDSEGHTPLHCAVEGGHTEVVKILVCKGADIHAENSKGITALQMAEALKYESIVSTLLNAMASPSLSLSSFTSNFSPLRLVTNQKKVFATRNYEETPRRSIWGTSPICYPPIVKKDRGTTYASGPLTTRIFSPSQDMEFAKETSQVSSLHTKREVSHSYRHNPILTSKVARTSSLYDSRHLNRYDMHVGSKHLIDFLREDR